MADRANQADGDDVTAAREACSEALEARLWADVGSEAPGEVARSGASSLGPR